MAGSPKKRERKRAQMEQDAGIGAPLHTPAAHLDAADPIPDAQPSRTTTVHAPAQYHAPAPTRPRTRSRPAPFAATGPQTRATADQLQAEQLAKFAAALQPGIALSIERLKPTWCAGWLEEYANQDGTIGELFAYIQQEYGGQLYRLTVTSPDGRPYYETRIAIAGQPRDRGRVIDRAKWEGLDEPHAAPAYHQAPAPSTSEPLFSKLLDIQMSHNRDVITAIERMGSQNTANARHLIETIVQTRESSEQRKSFLGSLQEVVDASHAIEQVKEVLRDETPQAGAEDTDDMVKQATKEFFKTVMLSKAQDMAVARQRPRTWKGPPGSAPPGTRTQAAPPVIPIKQRKTDPTQGVIDAIPAPRIRSKDGGESSGAGP